MGTLTFFTLEVTVDPLLSDHLQFAKKNASYLSPVIQNELIALAGLEVKESILKDVRSAGWFSVMADECTDVATLEQMSMCIRFVDESTPDQPQVREEFVGFVQLDRTSVAFISEAILQFLKDCNLNISNLHGQGYDGASVMASKVSGVSTQILEAQPRAMYHHCRGHNLNLVISSSCNQVPEIRNLFDSVRTISWFLGASGKRKFILRKQGRRNRGGHRGQGPTYFCALALAAASHARTTHSATRRGIYI